MKVTGVSTGGPRADRPGRAGAPDRDEFAPWRQWLIPDELRAGFATLDLLTARELTILRMLATGRDNRAVARYLGIREKTVKAHMTAILSKLGVASRLQAGLIAFAACLDGRLAWDENDSSPVGTAQSAVRA